MTFPAIQDADTKSGGETSSSTSHTITYCTNIAAGDRLILFTCNPGTPTYSNPTGWGSPIWTLGNTPIFKCYEKIADGTETGTFTITTSAGTLMSWVMYRITGAHPSAASARSSGSTATGTTPDPDTVTPSWGLADTLFLATCAYQNGTVTVTAYPSGYTNGANIRGNVSGGAGVGVARKTSQANSEDPGTFTISSSIVSRFATLAIRPAATAFTSTPGGALTPTGKETSAVGKPLAGGETPAGVIVKAIATPRAGALAPAGSLRDAIAKALAGALTPVGSERSAIGKPLAGSLTPAGTRSSAVGKALASTIAPSGFVDLLVHIGANFITLGGSITPTGRVAKAITLAPFAGEVAPSGSVSLPKAVLLALVGFLDPAGQFSTDEVTIVGGPAPVIADSVRGTIGDSVSDGHIEEPEPLRIGGP